MHMDVESRRTVRPTEFFIAVNNSPPWGEDIILVTSTFHMSMESSFETQCVGTRTQGGRRTTRRRVRGRASGHVRVQIQHSNIIRD